MMIPCWSVFETLLTASHDHDNPLHDVALRANFQSPSGQVRVADGFWDGDRRWLIRFAPDEVGTWSYTTICAQDGGLHGQSGSFDCTPAAALNPFQQHGHLRVSADRRYLIHADGTPFFWMGDTAWNGPLWSSDDDWEHYLQERVRQGFTVVQWVTTEWIGAPDGDADGQRGYSGHDPIRINPAFFQRLDRKLERILAYGLLPVPVLLWTAGWRDDLDKIVDPGYVLPEDEAALLARYLVARWGAHPLVWILPGDGVYDGEKAERWKRIGRQVFGERPHAPVSLHSQGTRWNWEEFRDESWLDLVGYQSGHGGVSDDFAWQVMGPPARDWARPPFRPFINLEPPYEQILGYHSHQPFSEASVRRGLYWSLLVAPTAGVTYGAHGVWSWADGIHFPNAHEIFGLPLDWRTSLTLPVAEQVQHLVKLFASLAWWTLTPAPDLISVQPGRADPERFIVASRNAEGSLAVIYIPSDRAIALDTRGLARNLTARWYNPRTGEYAGEALRIQRIIRLWLETPAEGDWVLVLRAGG